MRSGGGREEVGLVVRWMNENSRISEYRGTCKGLGLM